VVVKLHPFSFLIGLGDMARSRMMKPNNNELKEKQSKLKKKKDIKKVYLSIQNLFLSQTTS